MKKNQYVVVIEQDEDGVYIARVPDLPGCHTYGKTLDELDKNLEEAIALWVKNQKEATPPLKFHSLQFFELKAEGHLSRS
ncbi:MAG: type II toxin-antitoxin system HicB family antitoxin [bacterium]|nr:type II toxin-antitoxin system HicB family antitoxin [bacterium]